MFLICSPEDAQRLSQILSDAEACWDEYGLHDPATGKDATDSQREQMRQTVAKLRWQATGNIQLGIFRHLNTEHKQS